MNRRKFLQAIFAGGAAAVALPSLADTGWTMHSTSPGTSIPDLPLDTPRMGVWSFYIPNRWKFKTIVRNSAGEITHNGMWRPSSPNDWHWIPEKGEVPNPSWMMPIAEGDTVEFVFQDKDLAGLVYTPKMTADGKFEHSDFEGAWYYVKPQYA